MSSVHIVRQKAITEKVCDFKTDGILYSPCDDPTTSTMYLVSNSGQIFSFIEGQPDEKCKINGELNGICFDGNGFLYVTDLTSMCIWHKSTGRNY